MSKVSSCPFYGIEVFDGMGDGVTPVNPLGTCFDATAFQAVGPRGSVDKRPADLRICHGIGKDPTGSIRTHAWLEWRSPRHGLIAQDVIFQVFIPAKHYRDAGRFDYVVEYTFEKFMQLWAKHDYPGPWDRKIRRLTAELERKRDLRKS